MADAVSEQADFDDNTSDMQATDEANTECDNYAAQSTSAENAYGFLR
jgi:hypothetical protein